jgi:hypothetical protein
MDIMNGQKRKKFFVSEIKTFKKKIKILLFWQGFTMARIDV